MEWLSKLSVRRPVLAAVMMLTIVVVGFVGYRTLGVDKFPKVDFPLVTVTTVYPGAAPASVELDVTERSRPRSTPCPASRRCRRCRPRARRW